MIFPLGAAGEKLIQASPRLLAELSPGFFFGYIMVAIFSLLSRSFFAVVVAECGASFVDF